MEGIPPSIHDMGDLVSERERTIVGIGDLKKILAVFFGIGLTLVGYLCQHYNGQLIQIASQMAIRVEADHAQDKKIQKLEDNLDEARRSNDRSERAVQEQQRIQGEMLLQMNTLTGKMSATEEIARSTRDRVEALLDFVRKENKSAVISTEDSVYGPRSVTR